MFPSKECDFEGRMGWLDEPIGFSGGFHIIGVPLQFPEFVHYDLSFAHQNGIVAHIK